MKYHDIIAHVSNATGADRDRAENTVRAFLETLALRLPNDETKDLAAQLPAELKESLHSTTLDVKKLSREEFLQHFARSAELSNEQAPDVARTVWLVLERAVSPGELDQVRSVLPRELETAFA